jgi:prepilin-type N-terminal cleavage/methylation domain-containing protein
MHRSASGYTLLELIFVLALSATVAAAGLPIATTAVDEYKALGAARYLSMRLGRARLEAVKRHANTAMRFTLSGDTYRYAVYVDGNGDGVKSDDIGAGVDRELLPAETLPAHFGEVDFGVLPDLPAVDPSSPAPGNDPIKLGAANMVSFAPLGTATPGSLYIRSRRGAQYVLRIYGETAKTRVLKFNRLTLEWNPL